MRPLARRDGLVVRDLPDETIVYDRERHQAHCLNRTATLVFRHADGTRTAGEIASLLGDGEPREREAAVAMALELLSQARLLDERAAAPGASRRDTIRRVGIGAALLLPAVASVLAPTPAEAATCVDNCVSVVPSPPPGTPCNCFGQPCDGSAVCQGAGGCSFGGC